MTRNQIKTFAALLRHHVFVARTHPNNTPVCFKCRFERNKKAFDEMRYGGWTKPKPYTPTNRVKKVHIEDVRRLQEAGMTNAAIAQRLGVKPPAVSQCIARAHD